MPRPTPYLRLRQVCLVAPQLAPAVATLESVLGLPVCYRDPNVAKFGLENALFALGSSFLEIVAPLPGVADTAAERFIARSGGQGGYMLIFDCDDPAPRRARAEAMGVRIAFALSYADYRGVQLHPRDTRAVMLEFDHTDGGESLTGPYHPAGPDWQAGQRPGRVQGLAGAEVLSPDAAGLSAHWAALMDVAAISDGQGSYHLALDFGAVRIRPAPAGTPEHLARLQVAVGDPAAVLVAAAQAGCTVLGGRFEFAGVTIEPVAGATA